MAATNKSKQQAAKNIAIQINPNPNPLGIAAGPTIDELNERQAVAEQLREERGMPRIELGLDAFDKRLDAFGDPDYVDAEGGGDPLEEAVSKERARAGVTKDNDPMAYKFLSDRVNSSLGTRGYQVVKGQNGDPVKVGTLTLAMQPRARVERRKKHYLDQSKEAVTSITDTYAAKIEDLKSEAKGLGLAVLEQNEIADISSRAGRVTEGIIIEG